MNKDKKAQAISSILLVMLGVFAIVIGLVLSPALKEIVDTQRGNLDCAFDNLTLGQSSTCIIVDLTVPLFIAIVVFGVGLGAIQLVATSRR